MKKIIHEIQEKGWKKETMQLVREAVANQPTGRFTFYDLHKCFYENVDVDHVVKVLSELKYYKKHAPEMYREYTSEELMESYGNVTVSSEEYHRQFTDPEELIEFWNGTSLTRAKAFVDRGDGYTKLERFVYTTELTQYGIQVMLEDFRAYDYARQQAYALNDKPAIIHGFIKAKYLFGANNPNEYAIPCEYYIHMKNVEII